MYGARHLSVTLSGNRKDQALKWNFMEIIFFNQVSYKAIRYKNSDCNNWKHTVGNVISKAKLIC